MGPVIHKPCGIKTTPPPLALQSVIALLIALVFSVIPSATAPYFTMLKVSFLNTGTAAFGRLLHEYLVGVCAFKTPVQAIIKAMESDNFFINIYLGGI